MIVLFNFFHNLANIPIWRFNIFLTLVSGFVNNSILMKFNERKDNQDIYIVKVGTWRALVAITDEVMENILTLS